MYLFIFIFILKVFYYNTTLVKILYFTRVLTLIYYICLYVHTRVPIYFYTNMYIHINVSLYIYADYKNIFKIQYLDIYLYDGKNDVLLPP